MLAREDGPRLCRTGSRTYFQSYQGKPINNCTSCPNVTTEPAKGQMVASQTKHMKRRCLSGQIALRVCVPAGGKDGSNPGGYGSSFTVKTHSWQTWWAPHGMPFLNEPGGLDKKKKKNSRSYRPAMMDDQCVEVYGTWEGTRIRLSQHRATAQQCAARNPCTSRTLSTPLHTFPAKVDVGTCPLHVHAWRHLEHCQSPPNRSRTSLSHTAQLNQKGVRKVPPKFHILCSFPRAHPI